MLSLSTGSSLGRVQLASRGSCVILRKITASAVPEIEKKALEVAAPGTVKDYVSHVCPLCVSRGGWLSIGIDMKNISQAVHLTVFLTFEGSPADIYPNKASSSRHSIGIHSSLVAFEG